MKLTRRDVIVGGGAATLAACSEAPPRYCIECLWGEKREIVGITKTGESSVIPYIACLHPRAPRSLEYGIELPASKFRLHGQQCGPKGSMWEAKT